MHDGPCEIQAAAKKALTDIREFEEKPTLRPSLPYSLRFSTSLGLIRWSLRVSRP